MNCPEVAGRLFACEDGELSRAEVAAVREHLAGCESCRAIFESQAAIRGRLGSLFNEPVETPDIAGAVMAALPERRGPLVTKWKWALAAAAIAGVIVYGSVHRPPRVEVAKAPAPKHAPTWRVPEIRPIHTGVHPRPVEEMTRIGAMHPMRRTPAEHGIRIAHRPTGHPSLKPPVVWDQPRGIASSDEVISIETSSVTLPSGERISTTHTIVMAPSGECRSRVTTTIGLGAQALTQTEDKIITQAQPIAGADSIDRPPLQTAAVPADAGGGG